METMNKKHFYGSIYLIHFVDNYKYFLLIHDHNKYFFKNVF